MDVIRLIKIFRIIAFSRGNLKASVTVWSYGKLEIVCRHTARGIAQSFGLEGCGVLYGLVAFLYRYSFRGKCARASQLLSELRRAAAFNRRPLLLI